MQNLLSKWRVSINAQFGRYSASSIAERTALYPPPPKQQYPTVSLRATTQIERQSLPYIMINDIGEKSTLVQIS